MGVYLSVLRILLNNPFQMKSAENQLNSAKQPTKIKHYQAMGHWWRSYMQKNQDIVHKINYDIQMLNFVNMVLER